MGSKRVDDGLAGSQHSSRHQAVQEAVNEAPHSFHPMAFSEVIVPSPALPKPGVERAMHGLGVN